MQSSLPTSSKEFEEKQEQPSTDANHDSAAKSDSDEKQEEISPDSKEKVEAAAPNVNVSLTECGDFYCGDVLKRDDEA